MWTQYLDATGWGVRQDAEKVQLMTELYRQFGKRPGGKDSAEAYSRQRHGKEEFWKQHWVSSWQVAGGTPCWLWLFQKTADAEHAKDACCCVVIEKRCRDASHAYPRITYVRLDVDPALFATRDVSGTLIDGEIVFVPTAGQHVFLADDICSDAGTYLVADNRPTSTSLGQRMLRLQVILDQHVRARPGLDAFAMRVRPVFGTNCIAPSIAALKASPDQRLDYGSHRGCPVGVVMRSLLEVVPRAVVYRVHVPKGAGTHAPHAPHAPHDAPHDAPHAPHDGPHAPHDAGTGTGTGNDDDVASWSSYSSDADDDADRDVGPQLRKLFYVRVTHVSDVYELFEDLDEMNTMPERMGMAPLAAVPSVRDSDALRAAAKVRAPVWFVASKTRLGGKWTIELQ